MAAKRYVSTYENVRCYGGPEEGGWYYSVMELVDVRYFGSNKKARTEIATMELPYRQSAYIETAKNVGRKDTTNAPRPYYC